MPYLIFLMSSALILTIALHLRNQFRQTAHIRQRLQDARKNKTLNAVHYLRVDK
jgi:hypothetical protein